MIELVYTCRTDRDTGVKESRVQVDLSDGTFSLGPDIRWLNALQDFVKAPEGVSAAFAACIRLVRELTYTSHRCLRKSYRTSLFAYAWRCMASASS